jgi:hypothetical protein
LRVQGWAEVAIVVLVSRENVALIEAKAQLLGALARSVELVEAPAGCDAWESVALAREAFLTRIDADLLVTLGASDVLARGALASVDAHRRGTASSVITADEDRLYRERRLAPYHKGPARYEPDIAVRDLLRRLIVADRGAVERGLESVAPKDIEIIGAVLYHYRIVEEAAADNGVRAIALYLPQFHTIPENDVWWGKGFTEWTNVRRGRPMFAEHYQPHVPGEFGYYDLGADGPGTAMQRRQGELAARFGVYGFCYYYYWFAGQRLLERPLDRILADPSLDLPFCICWANETWSRRWDGSEDDILIAQAHSPEQDRRFIADVLPILADPRYIRVDGAPLLAVYRAELFQDFAATAEAWRAAARAAGIERLHIALVQSFQTGDPRDLGADSAIEFPPLGWFRSEVTAGLNGVDPAFTGRVFDYREVVEGVLAEPPTPYLRFRGVMTSWDNTARRMENGHVFIHATPEEYKMWLMALVDRLSRRPAPERIVFINAWNEWAEGAHLEPDQRWGEAWLRATREALAIIG